MDGKHSPSRQPYQFQKVVPQMGSDPHCLCPCHQKSYSIDGKLDFASWSFGCQLKV
jgi:hypothetical protein